MRVRPVVMLEREDCTEDATKKDCSKLERDIQGKVQQPDEYNKFIDTVATLIHKYGWNILEKK